MSKSLLFLLSLLFLITSAFLFLKASEKPKKNTPSITPTKTIVSETKLALSPNPIFATRGQEAQAWVTIETKGYLPKTIQLEMAFDPSAVTEVKLEPGPFFSNPKILLNNIDYRTGRISYALEALPDQKDYKKGDVQVAKVSFTALPSAPNGSALYFLPKTTVKDSNDINIMRSAFGSTIVFR